jgi:dTDP-4-dehydrorhamnose 3,5-epimerase
MPFRFTPAAISNVFVIEPRVFSDDRGLFMETYKRSDFAAHGIDETFVQCNQSKSTRGTLRGLHYQMNPKAQGKLVRSLSGEIYDVVVDLRHGSPSYGEWLGIVLSAENKQMLYVPSGFAHGFCVTSAEAEVSYMTTAEYAPELEAGVIWNDPALAIEWPISQPELSKRDRAWPCFHKADNNFRFATPVVRDRLP